MPQTIHTALQEATSLLAPIHDSARLDAEILLAYVLEKERTWLYTWPEHPLDGESLQRYTHLIERRAQGEPVAYLTGQREFWSMRLTLDRSTLIPRPETELLVEQALQHIPADAAWELLDLGTGSGAIALALAGERPRCRITATDYSAAALQVARNNAQQLGLTNLRFVEGDWFSPLHERQFHLIVSNPPYIPDSDPHLRRGDVRHEPVSALASGEDGLDDIRQLLSDARRHLLQDGWLLLEHGYDQAPRIKELFRQQGFDSVHSCQDLQGHPRITLGKC